MILEIGALLAFFKDPILEIIEDVSEDVANHFKKSIKTYLKVSFEKYSTTKTFLFRHGNIPFYNLYFPVRIREKKWIGFTLQSTQVDSVKELFVSDRYLIISGPAGSGKSMLTKHIFLSCIKEKFSIPILIELRKIDFKSNNSLLDYFKDHLDLSTISGDIDTFERELKKGKFLFILDGYDEIIPEDKQEFLNSLEDFVDRFPKNRILITSRLGTNIQSIPRFDNRSVCSLTQTEVNSFIELQMQVLGTDYLELKNKIFETIKADEDKSLQSYLSSPLLLSMFILTYEGNPYLPNKKSGFYQNVVETLFHRHDSSSKYGWSRKLKSNLSYDDIISIMKTFSFVGFFRQTFEFSSREVLELIRISTSNLETKISPEILLDDLIESLSIIVNDGSRYTFPHRSLQEYFTAQFISGKDLDFKKEIYLNKLSAITEKGLIELGNIFSLLNEVDEKDFNEIMILPVIEKLILTDIDGLTKIDSKEFFRVMESEVVYDINIDSFDGNAYAKIEAVGIPAMLERVVMNYLGFYFEDMADDLNVYSIELTDYLEITKTEVMENGDIQSASSSLLLLNYEESGLLENELEAIKDEIEGIIVGIKSRLDVIKSYKDILNLI